MMHLHFKHPSGKWYRLWITRTYPQTERGRPWHVHNMYDRNGTISPIGGTAWWEQQFGMDNWDFLEESDAIEAFNKRAMDRLEHGYQVTEGHYRP